MSEKPMGEKQAEIPGEIMESVFGTVATMLDSKRRMAAGNMFHQILPLVDNAAELQNFPNKGFLVELGLAKMDGEEMVVDQDACRAFKACFDVENDKLVLRDPRSK